MADQSNNTVGNSLQYLHVRNWGRWQSYRHDRGHPPWIKVHRRLMRNPNWVALTDAQKGQLVSIWMLAADQNGVVPHSPKLIKRLCCLEQEPDLSILIQLGFLDARLTPRRKAERRQLVAPEAETETETEAETEKKDIADPASLSQPPAKRKPRKIGEVLPSDWMPNERHYELGTKLGMDMEAVRSAAEDMRLWAEANSHRAVARKSNWDSTFSGWMKRNLNNSFTSNGANGHGRPKSAKERYSDLLQSLGSGEVREDAAGILPKFSTD